MKKILIVVDMQNDFIDGSLGTAEAAAIVPAVCEKICGFDGEIIATLDTHGEDYLNTSEGKKLPIAHCIKGTKGHEICGCVSAALDGKECIYVEKPTFGSLDLPEIIADVYGEDGLSIELCGLCTDICVVSNALILKARFPEAEISVDSKLCAGVTPTSHESALITMKSCQITVK